MQPAAATMMSSRRWSSPRAGSQRYREPPRRPRAASGRQPGKPQRRGRRTRTASRCGSWMSPWSDHDASSSLVVVLLTLVSAALMPRFDRVTTSTRAIFVLSWKTCRALDAVKAPVSGIPGKTRDFAWSRRWLVRGKRVNLPQASRRKFCPQPRADEASHRFARPTNRSWSYLGMTRSTREPIGAPAGRMDRAHRRITLLPAFGRASGSGRIENGTRSSTMSLQMSHPLGAQGSCRRLDRCLRHRWLPVRACGTPDRAGEKAMTLSLVHLDVALAIEHAAAGRAEFAGDGPSFRVSAKRLARASVETEREAGAGEFPDPVMRSLSDALAATEAAHILTPPSLRTPCVLPS